MGRDIRLWTINESQDNVKELVLEKGAESEDIFEGLLARNPNLLMQGLQLVARQAQTEGGSLDLLGIDDNGKMVVFELKRERLARESVAQIIDYSSYLDSLSEDEIAEYVIANSGKNGIDKIVDFQTWYEERYGQSEGELRPVRMMLVAFDADSAAQRMVEFLNERGVAISIQTFSKFGYGEEKLIVGHHDRAAEARSGTKKAMQSYEENIRALNQKANDLQLGDYWKDVVGSLQSINSMHPRNNRPPRKSGITFYERGIKLSDDGNNFRGSHSVLLEDVGKIKVTFFPIAIYLCKNTFEKASIPFEKEPPPNVPKADNVTEQWYCILNKQSWEKNKAELTKTAKQVHAAWEKRRKNGTVF